MRRDEKTTEKGRRRERERNKEKEKRWRNKVNRSLGARELEKFSERVRKLLKRRKYQN